jgi:formimidoylglutamate deiminase
MTESFYARQVLTADGWVRNARISISDGRIGAISPDDQAVPGEDVFGIVIPGLGNAHSHAFQRALVGHTEYRGPAGKDNFWTWRTRMYALAGQVDAPALATIARQVYAEMLATGYTSVAEFHYLHNEPGEKGVTEAMFDAIVEAAQDTGIRLTYVPVLYERAGFEAQEPTAAQRRFAMTADQLTDHYERARKAGGPAVQTGIGVHSLRAVTTDSLEMIAEIAERDDVPMHMHIAEQQREVDQCLAVTGLRPVQWLMEHFDVSENWCLVHATHIDEAEIQSLARSGAVVCLCPSTEANLGDGLFPLRSFLEQGGRIAIGSDSHVSINPFEELRWLEYGQRLVSESRNVAAIARPQTGRSLFEATSVGGAAACGQGNGELLAGGNADLVVLDDDSPLLAGHTSRSLLDALVFSGFTLPIDRVMVNGRWVVEEGRHIKEAGYQSDYIETISELNLAEVNS